MESKKYKCRTCKESFIKDQVFTVPNGWGYTVKICRSCYAILKNTVQKYDIELINLQLEKAE